MSPVPHAGPSDRGTVGAALMPAEGLMAGLPSWPSFDADEIAAVERVLASGKVNFWTGGECVAFESEFAAFAGTRHAISLANGTVALELALRALGIGPGDEVVVPARTFIATASCVVAVGATPIVADIDCRSQNLTPDSVAAVLSPRTKAIIPVHLAGWPCEMGPIMELARTRGIRVIEDCAQAHGATWQGAPVGSFGDAAAFSFCQDKIMTTGGEGGMLVTSDSDIWRRAWAFKDHGKSYAAVYERHHPPGFRWLHESFGSNYRMTEMQAAIGRVQLSKLPRWVRKRRALAATLDELLARTDGLEVHRPPEHSAHAYYRYYAFLGPALRARGCTQERVMEEAARIGVPCMTGACGEIYRERAFTSAGLGPPHPLPVARLLSETSLALPVHPTMEKGDAEWLAHGIKLAIMRASNG